MSNTVTPNDYGNDIQQEILSLQQGQSDLQNQLATNAANLTPQQQQTISNQISSYSSAIAALTGTVRNLNQVYATNLQNNTAALATQNNALSIINAETIDANNQITYINDQKISKMRQVEINNYYSAWYQEQIKLIKYLVYYVFIFTILFFLKTKNILSGQIFGIVIVLITVFFLFLIIPVILSILSRDNMNYSEYNWGFDKTKAPVIQGNANDASNNVLPSTAASTVNGASTAGVCVGSQCCPVGSVYDSSNNICSVGTGGSFTTNINLSNMFQNDGTGGGGSWFDGYGSY